MRATLLIFQQDEDVDRVCTSLSSIEMWLGNNVNVKCNIAKHKQQYTANWLITVDRNKTAPSEGKIIQSFRPIEDSHYIMSSHSVASQFQVKYWNLAFLVVKCTKRGSIIWSMGVQSKECVTEPFEGNTVGENSSFIIRCHNRPCMIPRAPCLSIKNNWKIRTGM